MRPVSIRVFEWCYLAAIALRVANFTIGFDVLRGQAEAELVGTALQPSDGLLVASIAFSVMIALALWFLIARLGVGFVKWIVIAQLAWELRTLPTVLAPPMGITDYIGLAIFGLQAVGIAFLFRADARRWFAREYDGQELR